MKARLQGDFKRIISTECTTETKIQTFVKPKTFKIAKIHICG